MHRCPKIPGLNQLTVNGHKFQWSDAGAATGYWAVSGDPRQLTRHGLLDAIKQRQLEELQWNYGGGNAAQSMVRALLLNYLKQVETQSQQAAGEALAEWFEEQQEQLRLEPLREEAKDADGNAVVSLGDDNGAYVASWEWVSGHDLSKEQQAALGLGSYFREAS